MKTLNKTKKRLYVMRDYSTVTIEDKLNVDSGGTSGILFGTGATQDPCDGAITFQTATIFWRIPSS